MPVDTQDAVAPFVAKWLAREPEMQFALNFCSTALRPRFAAWGALLHALREARFELREPAVADAKRDWWADEMRAIESGQGRHPLARALGGIAAPWPVLARELTSPPDEATRPADVGQSLALLDPLAQAVVAVESELFDNAATPDQAATRSVSVHWRLFQLPRGLADDELAGLPMDLIARHGLTRAAIAGALPTDLLRDWADALRAAQPAQCAGATPFRRARARFDALRLARLSRRGDDFAPAVAPRLLWHAWRAARG